MLYTLNINYQINKKKNEFYWMGSFKYQNEQDETTTIILQNSQNISELINQVRENMDKINNTKHFLRTGCDSSVSSVSVIICTGCLI
jgi:hypothetical protein